MADPSNNRGNKRSLRASLKFALWLFITICLPGGYAYCGAQNCLKIYPNGIIKVPYGEPLEVLCMVTDDKLTADDIEFREQGASVPSEKINTTSRRLYKEMPEKGVFTYYCENKRTKKRSRTRVLVDSTPLNVTDFVCKSYNLDELTCSWTSPETFSTINYSLSFLIYSLRGDPCKAIRIGRRYSCSWNVYSQPRYRQLEENFFFILTSSNIFGGNEQNFTLDHYSVVQPAPVSNEKILSIGTYSALLQWNIPNNMVDFLWNGVEHRIEYQVGNIDNASYFRSVDVSSLPRRNRTYIFLLSDLPYAHMQYEVRIYIKPIEATGEEYWSQPVVIKFYTSGKSTKEINKFIYQNWRRSRMRPISKFSRKLWQMKAQKALYKNWHPARNRLLSLMPFLISGTDHQTMDHQ